MNRLKTTMISTGQTQGELAADLGVTRAHLNAILSGKSVPSLELAFRLAARLGVAVGELWTLTEVGIVPCAADNRRTKQTVR